MRDKFEQIYLKFSLNTHEVDALEEQRKIMRLIYCNIPILILDIVILIKLDDMGEFMAESKDKLGQDLFQFLGFEKEGVSLQSLVIFSMGATAF